jgi:uncharacterized membrane protein YpjA
MNNIRPQLGGLQNESKILVNIISETSGLAEGISAKVRQLDLEQSRVQMAIKHVEDVQELKFCISGIQRAMVQSDHEDAARYMHKAHGFDKKILQGSFAEIAVVCSNLKDISLPGSISQCFMEVGAHLL